MSRNQVVAGILAVGLWGASSPAEAGPPKADDAPVVDHGTQIGAAPAVSDQYRKIRAQAKRPRTPGFRLAAGSAGPMTVRGELFRYDDGEMLLAVPVSAQQQAVLQRLGAKVVTVPGEIRRHTIHQGRYFRELGVAPPAGAPCAGCAEDRLVGPDPSRLRRFVGDEVVVRLARDRDGHAWVVGLEAR